jgi:hypothetical protein
VDDDRKGDDEGAGQQSRRDVALLKDVLVEVGWGQPVEDAVADEEQDETQEREQDRDEDVVQDLIHLVCFARSLRSTDSMDATWAGGRSDRAP